MIGYTVWRSRQNSPSQWDWSGVPQASTRADKQTGKSQAEIVAPRVASKPAEANPLQKKESPSVSPASGIYEMAQLEKLLIGKHRDYVVQFLGSPSSITNLPAITNEDKGKTILAWHYLMSDNHGRPIRAYQVNGSLGPLTCKSCDKMGLTMKGDDPQSVIVTTLTMWSDKDAERIKRDFERPILEEEFKRRVLSTRTALGIPIFSKMEINGSDLHLWLSDASFAGPNMRNFAEIGTAYAQLCNCQPITYVGLDMTHLGGGRQILMQFKYDEHEGQSILQ